MTDSRTGIGYDSHRLQSGRPLLIGGVRIPHTRGLLGHSDGDVLLHALVDAILGAAALGDLGSLFPDTDPRWKGADSQMFVKTALQKIRKEKFRIHFVDGIILAEKPKLSPYFESIRKNLERLLTLPKARISVKAKTGEGLGEIGKEQALAAFVAVTLHKG